MSAPAISPTLRAAIEHHQAGRVQEAERLYRAVLAVDPQCVDALHFLGVIGLQCGQTAAAAELLGQAAALAPDDPAVQGNYGVALRNLGRFDEAAASFRRALAVQPDDSIALSNLGNVLMLLGQLDAALVPLERALALRPDHANAHNNLGELLRRRREFARASEVFRRAIALQPNLAAAHNNLGSVLTLLGRLDEAEACFQRGLALDPNLTEAHNNLGALLALRGELDGALASVRRALALEPARADLHSNLILLSLYRAGDDAAAIAAEQQRWDAQHGAPLAAALPPAPNDRTPDRPLRIGYVSADFRDHVVGRNLLPLFERHDRAQFEVFCYAHVPAPDAITARFRVAAAHWRDIVPLNDAQLADRVRADRIDVLVDLALHTAKNRLGAFARRPAPVQVSFGGYPGDTGLTAIGHHLTDSYLEPPDAPDAAKAYRLPHSFWCYEAIASDEPVAASPAVTRGAVTFGCLNNFIKVTDATLALWARVLAAVPDSRLLLQIPAGRARPRILAGLERVGVAASRVELVDRQPRERYFALHHGIDVGLDTFPYNGHTTSLDAFWMGVPVVTLVGPTAVGRAGWSQLSNLGLTDLAAHTPDDFVRIAATLARDPARLAALRATLRDRMRASPLMDGAAFARGIEDAYRALWRAWCTRPGGPVTPS